MAKKEDGSDKLSCSFCGKQQKEVKKLIAGPGVYICDECVGLCGEIIEDDGKDVKTEGKSMSKRLAPREIKELLDTYVIEQEQAKKSAFCGCL